jgi:hypothetical protein
VGSKKAEAESGTALETTKKQGQRPDEDFGPGVFGVKVSEFSGDGSDDNMCD